MLPGNGANGMTPLFCYGTLRHPPLLEIVLGRPLDGLHVSEAILPDHAVCQVKGQSFPMIVPENGAQAAGLLVRDLTASDIARLEFYESGFERNLNPVQVTPEAGTPESAQVFFADASLWSPGDPWSLQDWVNEWAALSCRAATEVMDYFGVKSDADLARLFPMITARAAASLNAVAGRRPTSPSGMSCDNIKVVDHIRAYTDFFAMDEYNLSFDRFDGSSSAVVKRSVFLGGDAAIVLPYDPVRDRVLLVEQMRMGPFGRGDPDVWQLEPIAGRLDAGEAPEDTARREALEEAGVTLGRIETVAECYPSPGSSSEFFYIYVGLADLHDGLAATGGLVSEHEDIRSHLIDFDRLMEMTESFAVKNAPLALAALWLARHRDRLRKSGAE